MFRRFSPLILAGVLAVTLAACGSSSSKTATAAGSTPAAGTQAGAARTPPGTSGTIAAVTGSSLEIQNAQTGQVTVTFTAATRITQTVDVKADVLAVGDCVVASGAPATGSTGSTAATGGPVTAATVAVSKPTSSGCTRGFGTRTPTPGRTPAPGRTAFPGGGGRRLPIASGTVTSIAGSTFVVKGTSRTGVVTTTTVTDTASTTFTTTSAATASALVVGRCATAIGKADDTGAVAATSIAVRPATASGCTSGFGGFGGFGRGQGAGTTSA